MAQTGYTPIQHYYSITGGNTPTTGNLTLGEIAINVADQKVYMLNSASNAVVTLVGTLGNQNANSVSITGGSINNTTIGASTASTGAFTTISASGVITSTVSTGTAPFTVSSTTQVANLNAATAGTATNATNTAITDNTSSSATWYPTIVSATTGNLPQTTSSTKFSFVPSTGTLTTSYLTPTNPLGTAYGGTGLTSFTANGLVYASSSSALATGSGLQFTGTNLGIGTTSPGYPLTVSLATQNLIQLQNTNAGTKFWYEAVSSGNTYYFLNGSNVGVQIADGGNSWSAYSDSRLKNVTGTYANPLSDIAQLQPVKFTWKSDTTNKPCVGVIAQSVQTVVPEAVDQFKLANADELNDQTEYLSVRYTELIPLMIASIQALTAKVTALEAKVGA